MGRHAGLSALRPRVLILPRLLALARACLRFERSTLGVYLALGAHSAHGRHLTHRVSAPAFAAAARRARRLPGAAALQASRLECSLEPLAARRRAGRQAPDALPRRRLRADGGGADGAGLHGVPGARNLKDLLRQARGSPDVPFRVAPERSRGVWVNNGPLLSSGGKGPRLVFALRSIRAGFSRDSVSGFVHIYVLSFVRRVV